MGLSVFLPPGKSDAIEVDVWYADYDKIELPHRALGPDGRPAGSACLTVRFA